jgi:hypothetical protein
VAHEKLHRDGGRLHDLNEALLAIFDRFEEAEILLGAEIGRLEPLDAMAERFDAKFDGLKESLAIAKIWALFLYIELAAVNLGSLARGFGWI